MQHHAPRSSCAFQQKQNDMKNSHSLPMEKKVIFQTTKLGTGFFDFPTTQVLNSVQPTFHRSFRNPRLRKDFSCREFACIISSLTNHHFQIISLNCFLLPPPKVLSPKLSPPLCSSVWFPPTRQRARKSHKMLPFQRKIWHLDLETEFHEDWVYCTKLKSDVRSNLKLKIPSNHSIQIPMAKIPPVHRITSAYNVCVIMCIYTYLVYMHVEKGFVTSSSFHHESPIAIYTCIGHICTLISPNLIFWSLPRIFRNIRILGRTNLDLTQPLPIFELSPANLRAPSMVSRCA